MAEERKPHREDTGMSDCLRLRHNQNKQDHCIHCLCHANRFQTGSQEEHYWERGRGGGRTCREIFSEAWCKGKLKCSGQADISLANKQTKTRKHETLQELETCGALRIAIIRTLTPVMINLKPTLKTQEKELCVHFYPQSYLTQSPHARQLSTIKYEV